MPITIRHVIVFSVLLFVAALNVAAFGSTVDTFAWAVLSASAAVVDCLLFTVLSTWVWSHLAFAWRKNRVIWPRKNRLPKAKAKTDG